MTNVRHALLALFVTLTAACGTASSPETERPFARPAGYWEGKGTLEKTDMKDDFRDMKRSAEFTFWFVLDGTGAVNGEVEVLYDATLTVKNLPELSMSSVAPFSTSATFIFQPKVGGMVTDPNPRRRFPLRGHYDGALTLAISGLDSAKPIQFTIRGDAGVGGGIASEKHGSVSVEKPGHKDQLVIEAPMKPFSPFLESADVEKRPNGPHTSRYEVNDPDLSIYWTATQINTREERR